MTVGTIGDVALSCVRDAEIRMSPEELFVDWDDEAVAPHADALGPRFYNRALRVHALPVHCWIVRAGDLTVLVDTGCGDDKLRPLADLHMLRTGFLERLAAAGLAPEDVDVVLCTHLHADHVGWNTRLEDGRWVPTFPNARYVAAAAELAFAEGAGPGMQRDVYQDSVLPIVKAGRMHAVDGPFELSDSITLTPAPGHTPGHVRVELCSRGRLGILSGDILHTPLQAPFWRWRTRLAEDTDRDVLTRRALLEDCVERDALLIPAHFHPPAVGRVRAAGDDFAIELGW